MNQRLEPYALWRGSEAQNALRETVVTWYQAGTVRAAVSVGSGSLSTQNELKRVDGTHTAVTWDAVQIGDRLRKSEGDATGTSFEVLFIVDGGRRRMHQLYLRREDEPPNREAVG